MEKSCRKCTPKAIPRPLSYFGKQPNKPLLARIFFKVRYFERGLSKTFKVNFVFLLNPVPFNGQSYQKQKGSGTSDQSLFRLQNKFIKNFLLVVHYLTKFDGVIQSSF